MVNNVMSCAISKDVPIYLCENVMCRLCGCTGNNMSFILLKESCYLVKIIKHETNVNIRDSDILPRTVCRTCIDKVQLIQHFKSHCRRTQKILEDMRHSTNTDNIDLLNAKIIKVERSDNNNTIKTSEDDSEMTVEWLDEEFIINHQQLENNNSKYGVMYNDTSIFKNVHVTIQEQNLPENAIVIPYKILGQTTKPRVQTYSNAELSKLSVNKNLTDPAEKMNEEPIIADNTYVKLNETEASGPLLYRLLTSDIKPKKNFKPKPALRFHDEILKIIEETKDKKSIEIIEKTNENNNIIVSKELETIEIENDACPTERTDRSGRVFKSNSHKYVKKISPKEYSCTICNEKFRYPFQVEVHVRKHIGELPFSCKSCDKKFITGFYLLKHEKTHTGGQYICEVCGKNFRQSYALRDHQRIHNDSSPSFKCEHCGKEFFTKGNYDTHKLIHAEKKHICEICGKRFSLFSMMRRHLNRHKNNTFQCPLCPKLSKTIEEFTQHRKRHEKNGLFRCNPCSLSFWTKKGFQMHERVSHKYETSFETTTAVNNIINENMEFIYTDSLTD